MINFYIIAEEDFKDTSLKEENYEGNKYIKRLFYNYEGNNRTNTRKL